MHGGRYGGGKYDPDDWVNNPKGLIADLERGDSEGKTRVVIAQF